MSTKLYSGLRAHTPDPLALAQTIRQRLAPIAREAEQVQYGEDLTTVWDLALTGNLDTATIPTDARVTTAARLHRINQDRADSSPGRNNGPLDWEVTILPHDETSLLLLVHAANPQYYAELLESEEITEYGYWDNSDQPEGVTDEEWATRRRDWKEVLKPDWVPANHGVAVRASAWSPSARAVRREGGTWLEQALTSQASVRSRLISPLVSLASQDLPREDLPSVLPGVVMDMALALREASAETVEGLSSVLRPLTIEDVRGPLPGEAPVVNEDAAQQFLEALRENTT